MNPEDRLTAAALLGRDTFDVDEEEAHIVVDPAICATCTGKPCLSVCPAQLYALGPGGEMTFDHAGCLECGTCRVVCVTGGIVRWTYPRGTYGITYRYG
ncbi:ferredoxin [Streptomyces sp. NPDC047000]|uniref:ferredoxin family protein n=1 Tax=Streptomyces sp. NPDC047000 TaxID=3155474 RepID=UPI0034022A34